MLRSIVPRSGRTFVLMRAYFLLCLGDQMVQEHGTHMERRSSESTEGILLNAGFQIVHIVVLASKCEVGHIDENKFCMVRPLPV